MKPFGSHRPPDKLIEELPFMISSEDFYMNYVIKHKPVVFKGNVEIKYTMPKFVAVKQGGKQLQVFSIL